MLAVQLRLYMVNEPIAESHFRSISKDLKGTTLGPKLITE